MLRRQPAATSVEVCNKDTSRCEPVAATLAATDMACPDPWYPQIYGVCTQSCGSGNPDCDLTCGAAQDAGLTLDCVLGSTGADKCLCSNVGGHTANECQNAANPGYKCCTCKSIVGQSEQQRPAATVTARAASTVKMCQSVEDNVTAHARARLARRRARDGRSPASRAPPARLARRSPSSTRAPTRVRSVPATSSRTRSSSSTTPSRARDCARIVDAIGDAFAPSVEPRTAPRRGASTKRTVRGDERGVRATAVRARARRGERSRFEIDDAAGLNPNVRVYRYRERRALRRARRRARDGARETKQVHGVVLSRRRRRRGRGDDFLRRSRRRAVSRATEDRTGALFQARRGHARTRGGGSAQGDEVRAQERRVVLMR